MLGFILLLTAPLLIGGLVLSNVFGDDDDDDEASRQQDQDREDDEAALSNENTIIRNEDIFLTNTGEDVLIGRDGVDVYFQNEDINFEDAPLEINLRGGSDIAEIERGFRGPGSVVLRGGEGDDTLSSDGLEVVIRGGTGDDRINAEDTSFTFGGEGDDEIIVDVRGSRDEDVSTLIDGGPGDDTLTAIKLFRTGPDNMTPVIMIGGDGADTFTVDVRSASLPGVGDDEPRPIELSELATITDFDPDEDKLVITYESSSPVVEFNVRQAPSSSGEGSTFVQFTTSGNSVEEPVVGSVRLAGLLDLTVEDVEFVRTGGLIVGT